MHKRLFPAWGSYNNDQTVKNNYPLLLITDLIDNMGVIRAPNRKRIKI